MTTLYEIFDNLKYIYEKVEKKICDTRKCEDCPYDCIENDLMTIEDQIENVIIDLTALTGKE